MVVQHLHSTGALVYGQKRDPGCVADADRNGPGGPTPEGETATRGANARPFKPIIGNVPPRAACHFNVPPGVNLIFPLFQQAGTLSVVWHAGIY